MPTIKWQSFVNRESFQIELHNIFKHDCQNMSGIKDNEFIYEFLV